MNKNVINFIFLIVGILFGIIISSGIKYPFDPKSLDTIKDVCNDKQPIKKIKIGITGKISEVECSNSTVFRID